MCYVPTKRTAFGIRIIFTNTSEIRAYLRATSKLVANIENMTMLIVNGLRKTGVQTGAKRHAFGLIERWIKNGKASSLKNKLNAFRSRKHGYCQKTRLERRKQHIF